MKRRTDPLSVFFDALSVVFTGQKHMGGAGAEGFAILMVFTVWAEVVSNSWLVIAEDGVDATTPAGLLVAIAGGDEVVRQHLSRLSPAGLVVALRTLFHLKLILRLQDGSLRLTTVGQKAVS